MLPKFSRLEKLIGEDNLQSLSNKSVLVLGVGGVGGYVVEALARSGVGKLILVDYDLIDVTNINRQIIALDSTIGKLKVDVFEERIKDINPNCTVVKIKSLINEDNFQSLFREKVDFFVDACDAMIVKKMVISECLKKNIPFISSMGTGNKLDPSKLQIVDIRKTINDPIAKNLRKYVKDKKINKKVIVCSSSEVPLKMSDKVVGSCSFVPASAGLLIAGYVVRYFCK